MPELSPKQSSALAALKPLARTIGSGEGLPLFDGRRPGRAGGGTHGVAGGYAELQVTSNFSFLRGGSHPWELVERAAALGLAALAITDRNSVAGLVRAHQAAKTAGIRLVVGVRLDLRDGMSLLAFPEDRAAYGRLTTLLTLGKRLAPKGECHLDYPDVVAHGAGLVVALLPPEDFVDPAANRVSLAAHHTRAAQLAADFAGRAYLVAHHLYRGDDARRLARLAQVAAATGLKLLATGDVLYHIPERRPLQDVVTCIREHCTVAAAGFRLAANAERHLKPAAEMARLFRGHEAALAASLEIAARCRFSLDELRYEYPEVPVPPGMTPQQRLAQLAWEGAAEKFGCKTGVASFETVASLPPQDDDLFDGIENGRHPESLAQNEMIQTITSPPRKRGPRATTLTNNKYSFHRFPLGSRFRGKDEEIRRTGKRRIHVEPGSEEPPKAASRRTQESAPETPNAHPHPDPAPPAGEGARLVRWRSPSPSPAGGAGAGWGDSEGIGLSVIPPSIRARIEHELALIERLDYARYFLTVHDIVRFARAKDILCQGRGSAANSVVCYCLGITAVDPEKIDVLFERFISAARNEPPDIDVDFEHERREEVIQYIYEHYGRDHAGLAATLITYRSRGALREVGKVMGLSGDVVAALTGMVWGWSSERLRDERVREAGLDPADRNLRLALDLAGALIGFPRHLSQHVGGFVITRGPLHELVPIENAAMADRTVIEWDKDDLDALGILKIDVLALGMLTCIRKAFDLLKRHKDEDYALATVPREEPAVYAMLTKADSVGVFQVESRAQMSMLPRLKPREFYDLVIEVAIVRPGPIQGDMVHPYLRRRNGLEKIVCPPGLEHVLSKTMGVPLFQEQAMRIAIDGAGFSPDDADRLRRSMASFRRNGDIEKFRDKFIAGMVANHYPRDFAERCFSQIEGFGTYGFPESHAASFSLLVYVSAWVKCRHPDVFACALLNSQPMGFYQPAQIVRDAREHGVTVLPADVNYSEWDCTLEDGAIDLASFETAAAQPPQDDDLFRWHKENRHPEVLCEAKPRRTHDAQPTHRYALRLGFRQIKGFSQADAERLVAARGAGYPDVEALWRRSGLGRAALERLAAADALRSMTLDRRQGLWTLKALGEAPLPLFASSPSPAMRERVAPGTARRRVRADLAATPSPRERNEAIAAALLPPMPLGEHVVEDYASTSLSLKRHPLAFLRAELAAEGVVTAAELTTLPVERRVRVAGLVLIRQRPGSAKGVIFITLEDETGVANLILWPPILERFRRTALGATLLYCRGRLQREEGVIHVVAEDLRDFTPRLHSLRERDASQPRRTLPFKLPERVPGHDPRDFFEPTINIRSRDFR